MIDALEPRTDETLPDRNPAFILERNSFLDVAFYAYTIIVMLVCIAASTTAVSSYVITRNRLFLFASGALFLYFIDLAFIFQTEYIDHTSMMSIEAYYEVKRPAIKAILAMGILEFIWLLILEYVGKRDVALAVAPPLVFLVIDTFIFSVMPEGRFMQWCFYSAREAFLIWCLAYFVYQGRKQTASPIMAARIRKHRRLAIVSAILIALIVCENTFMILVWQPSIEVMQSMLPLYFSERNVSENILVLVFAILTIRRGMKTLRLRHIEPPTSIDSDQARYVESALDLYGERHSLTRREREILEGIIQGKDYQNIASDLQLAIGTVKSHTHNIFQKTGVKSRQELLRDFWGN